MFSNCPTKVLTDSSRNDVAQFQNWKRKTDYDLNLLCVSFNAPVPSQSDILVYNGLTSSITKNVMYFLLCFLIPVPCRKNL